MQFPPGHPDGPPSSESQQPEKKTVVDRLTDVLGSVVVVLFGILVCSAFAWLIAWLWTNMP